MRFGLVGAGKSLGREYDKIADPKHDYRFCRQHFHDKPSLPFIYPHSQEPQAERKLLDSSIIAKYVEWRSQGKEDGLPTFVDAPNRTCLSALGVVSAGLCQNVTRWQWKNALSRPRRQLVCLRALLPSLCGLLSDEYECPDSDEKMYLSRVTGMEDKSALSLADSLTSLIQRPAMVLSKGRLSNPAGGVYTMPVHYAFPCVERGELVSAPSLKDNSSASHLEPCLLTALGKYSYMDGSLRGNILSMESWAMTMLSAPSGINAFYRLLLLTQGSCKVRTTLINIDKDSVRQVELVLPRLPIMDPNWTPPRPDSNMAPKHLAIIMDEALFYPFQLVPFSVFRDAPYGNHLNLIADVLDGIKRIYAELRQLFMEHPEQRAIYSEAKEVC